ncbi:MAG: hypothetical protein L6R38_001774 [Xanthoria sp. 2 TBL-2021]|nr:MAG: hypothetical protein L6R38_001774 [Xanthoria sp. 2 TBL-2021]
MSTASIARNPQPVSNSSTNSSTNSIDLLILGAGWTYTFLMPLLHHHKISYQATTRDGRRIPGLAKGTVPFTFDPASDDAAPYRTLPSAGAVLIVFPLKGRGQSTRLVEMYNNVHKEEAGRRRWIQLGSTGVWKGEGWLDRHSPVDLSSERAVAEEELLTLVGKNACILNLAGLWGGERNPRNWVSRVAKTKEDVQRKGALHLVHGEDIARAIIGCLEKWEGVGAGRWIVCDLRTWDWWDLILGWDGGKKDGGLEEGRNPEYGKWVLELMEEQEVRALPRGREILGRCLDGREFWKKVGTVPQRTLLQ